MSNAPKAGTPRMSFVGLWPTYLIRRHLPGFEEPTEALAALILEQEARETDFTARYLEQNFFSSEHPAVRWLHTQIDETAAAFLAQMGVALAPKWSLFGWYNVNRLGDHHAPHTHPKSYLSGTYYVRLPPSAAGTDDPLARPACISFYDPRNGASMISVGTEPDARSSHTVLPVPGNLLLWPSPVQHGVHPNLTDELRITISFNLVVGRS